MNIRTLLMLLTVFPAAQGCYASSSMSFEPGAQGADHDADRPDITPDTGTPDADAADASDFAGEEVPDQFENIISLQYRDGYVYMVSTGGDFVVVDVSDPGSPVTAAYLFLGRQPAGLYLHGDHAYMAAYSGPFRIIDISDPLRPTPIEITSLSMVGNGRDVFVSGNYAYTTCNSMEAFRLYIIDVRDPTNPQHAFFALTGLQSQGRGLIRIRQADGGGLDAVATAVSPVLHHPVEPEVPQGPHEQNAPRPYDNIM